MDIELHHPGIDATCLVKTDAQADILAESGWERTGNLVDPDQVEAEDADQPQDGEN